MKCMNRWTINHSVRPWETYIMVAILEVFFFFHIHMDLTEWRNDRMLYIIYKDIDCIYTQIYCVATRHSPPKIKKPQKVPLNQKFQLINLTSYFLTGPSPFMDWCNQRGSEQYKVPNLYLVKSTTLTIVITVMMIINVITNVSWLACC